MRFFGVLFLIVGVISVIIGLFLLVPLLWGIPLTILGVIMVHVGGKAARRKKRAGIEVKIRKTELKKEQGKLDPAKADLLIGKLKIKQAKYKE